MRLPIGGTFTDFVLSDPASGALDGLRRIVADYGGHADLLALDMGGITAKACLIEGGRAQLWAMRPVDELLHLGRVGGLRRGDHVLPPVSGA